MDTECTWTLDADYDGDSWDTSCGEKFCFIDGTPSQNQMRFCGYCGGRLVEVVPEPEPEED
jgi:hypothetical protein